MSSTKKFGWKKAKQGQGRLSCWLFVGHSGYKAKFCTWLVTFLMARPEHCVYDLKNSFLWINATVESIWPKGMSQLQAISLYLSTAVIKKFLVNKRFENYVRWDNTILFQWWDELIMAPSIPAVLMANSPISKVSMPNPLDQGALCHRWVIHHLELECDGGLEKFI